MGVDEAGLDADQGAEEGTVEDIHFAQRGPVVREGIWLGQTDGGVRTGFGETRTEECKHEYRYGGVVYEDGELILGSFVKRRYYHDWFYCTHCLKDTYKRKPGWDDSHAIYYDATPMRDADDG